MLRVATDKHQMDDMERDEIVVLFIPVRKGMMKTMESFYGDVLRFHIEGGEFYVNNLAGIRGQLQYSRVEIDPAKNPLLQFNIASEFPAYCNSLRNKGVRFQFVAMTPGGYMAKIFDPCDNSLLIGCDNFENSSNVDLTSWDEYRRY